MKVLALFAGVLVCLLNVSCISANNAQSSASALAAPEKIRDVQITFYHAVFDTAFYNASGTTAESLFKAALENRSLTAFGVLNIALGSTASFTNSKQIRYQETLEGAMATADIGSIVEFTPVQESEGLSLIRVIMNPKRTSRLEDMPLTVRGESFPQPVFSVVETRTTFSAKLDTPVVYMVRPLSDDFDGKGDYVGKLEVFFFIIKKLN